MYSKAIVTAIITAALSIAATQAQERKLPQIKLHTQMAAETPEGGSMQFRARQLRLEARGSIDSTFSYRWRQRLNRSFDGGKFIDNLASSLDYAGIGVRLSPRLDLFFGRQCAAFGGYEFDANPIEIYEFSDYVDQMPCFLTGVKASYVLSQQHTLTLQVLNSHTWSLQETYKGALPDLTPARLPLLYLLQWHGHFSPHFEVLWSYNYMQQSSKHALHNIMLGQRIDLGRVWAYGDVMYSRQQLNLFGLHNPDKPVDHLSFVAKAGVRLGAGWQFTTKMMHELAKTPSISDKRTSQGIVAAIEYYPRLHDNLHFFVNYVGRRVVDQSEISSRASAGFVWSIPLL